MEPAGIVNTPEQNARNLLRVGTNSKPSRVRAVTQFGKKRALSAPENTGWRGLYKTVLVGCRASCRGHPLLGRAAFRPFFSESGHGSRYSNPFHFHKGPAAQNEGIKGKSYREFLA